MTRRANRPSTLMALGAVIALATASVGLAQEWTSPPPGGWNFAYEANEGEGAAGSGDDGAFDALDGTFSHSNGSDEWDGSAFGDGRPGRSRDRRRFLFARPGTPVTLVITATAIPARTAKSTSGTTFRPTASRRRRSMTGSPCTSACALRPATRSTRVIPTVAETSSIGRPGAMDIRSTTVGRGTCPFTRRRAGRSRFRCRPRATAKPRCSTNNLNGNAVSGDVDTGEAGSPNFLSLDPTEWQELWITIASGGEGTHQVVIYSNGNNAPVATLDVTAGDGSDFADMSYVAIGVGSTGQAGAIDYDFVRVASGVHPPLTLFDVPFRVNMGDVSVVDSLGRTWLGDPGPARMSSASDRWTTAGRTPHRATGATSFPDTFVDTGYGAIIPGTEAMFRSIRWDPGVDADPFLIEIPLPNGGVPRQPVPL